MPTDNATTGSQAQASTRPSWRKIAYRKLGKHGGSLMLCVPRVFAYALKVFRGADFELTLDEDCEGFHARVVTRGRIRPTPPGNIHGVAEVER